MVRDLQCTFCKKVGNKIKTIFDQYLITYEACVVSQFCHLFEISQKNDFSQN